MAGHVKLTGVKEHTGRIRIFSQINNYDSDISGMVEVFNKHIKFLLEKNRNFKEENIQETPLAPSY